MVLLKYPILKKQDRKKSWKIEIANNKIYEYKNRISDDTNKSAEHRIEKQINNKSNKINEYEEKLKDFENIENVNARNTKPDQFVSLLKSGILNLFRYILIICPGLHDKKAPMEKMMHLIINRKGRIIESNFSKQYIFERPSTKENCRLLKKFCANLNMLNVSTSNGKKIIASLEHG